MPAKKVVTKVDGKPVVKGKDGKLHYGKGTKGGNAIQPKKSKVKIDDIEIESSLEDFEEDDFDPSEEIDLHSIVDNSRDDETVYVTPDGGIYPSNEVAIFRTTGFTEDQLLELIKASTFEEQARKVKKFTEERNLVAYAPVTKHYFTIDGDWGDASALREFDSRDEADDALEFEDEQIDRGYSYY